MNITFDELGIEEILHFIGNANHEPDERMLCDIEEMRKRVIALSTPRFVYQVFPYVHGQLQNTTLKLSGNDIKHLLKNCHHCILMAVTLGNEIDTEMKRLQLMDMGKAVLFDSCANAAIECVCDQIQQQLEDEYKIKKRYLSERYSCGYGDLPISIQKTFLDVLQAQKKAGIYVNESSILHPLKSVTAIIGISDEIQPAILSGCDYCALRDTCVYRKGGTTCGKAK